MQIYQRTLARAASCSGVGLHSGKPVRLVIHPAPPNHGIQFIRTDLPDSPRITAHFNRVVDTSQATVIGYDGFIVSTIEHLMAGLAGLSVDNALVAIDSHEVPVMDGSAEPFTRMIREAGILIQEAPRHFFAINRPIELCCNGKCVQAYPSDRLTITCTIDFRHPMVGRQTYTIDVSEDVFEAEVAPARTFGFLKDVETMKHFGLARGGSLDNAVVLGEKGILNGGGLRFKDEFVRHKLLDSIGDFSLLGMPILGHIVLTRTGHEFNHRFLKTFLEDKSCWDTLTFADLDPSAYSHPKSLAN